MTESAYPKLTLAEQIFKDLVWDTGIIVGETYLERVAPFLKLPVIHQAEEEIIKLVMDKLFYSIVLVIDLTAIKFVNSAHQAAYERASLKLKVVAHDKGIDSDEFRKARDEDAQAFAKFVRFGATA